METCNQSHIQAVCVTHQENHFRFANILVECLPNVYIGRATNHLTTDVSEWEHSVIYKSVGIRQPAANKKSLPCSISNVFSHIYMDVYIYIIYIQYIFTFC